MKTDSTLGVPQTNQAEQPLVDLAVTLCDEGDLTGALDAYEQTVQLAPHRADLFVAIGALYQVLDQPTSALEAYQRAVTADPDFVPARQNLGYLLCNLGEPEQALQHYEHALQVRPSPMTHVLAATVLPAVYDSIEEVHRWRTRFAARVHELAEVGLRVETRRSQIPTNFYLAYQGHNDREIAQLLGRIYRGHELCNPANDVPLRPRNGRLRIGFLSSFFRDHTIGRLNLGIVQHLSRAKFEVAVLTFASCGDELSEAFVQAADQYLVVPRDVEVARQFVAEQGLDVLIFADVGMDAITSTLAYSRMAPVQCASWGHPDTTGSPTIDYYLSSSQLESAEADAHYTERLVRLPLIGVYYHRPALPNPCRTRAEFGVGECRHIYACPQTLYKFHPEFDAILSGILERDPAAEMILLEGRASNWTDRLRRRFERTLAARDRVRFLPPLSYQDFLSLLAVSDVVLDPLHFGGGNSSYEALAMESPIVTLPSPYLRGRITAALYQKMNFTDLITESAEQYIATALRLATDLKFNRQVRQRIRETNSVLFEDPEEVRGLEEFLWSLTEDRR